MDPGFQLFTTVRYDPQLTVIRGEDAFQHVGWNYEHASPLYMFDLHRDRLLKAARYWDWQPAISVLSQDLALDYLSKLTLDHVANQPEGPIRVKILVSSLGHVTVESGITKPKPLENLFPKRLPAPGEVVSEVDPKRSPTYTLVLDSAMLSASPFTNFKTTNRLQYDKARERVSIALTDPKEVLVVNEDNGHVMEGTIFTPYFWRTGRWVTPPVASQSQQRSGSGGQDGTTRRWALERGLAVEEVVLASSISTGEECWLSNGLQGFVSARVELGPQI